MARAADFSMNRSWTASFASGLVDSFEVCSMKTFFALTCWSAPMIHLSDTGDKKLRCIFLRRIINNELNNSLRQSPGISAHKGLNKNSL